MKTSFNLLLMALVAILMTACHNNQSKIRSFIPGTYVNHSEGEYSIADDTLIIRQFSSESNIYHIDRKTLFRRISYGKLMKTQRKNAKWIAVYDEKTGMMQETKMGKMISIYPDSGLIAVGKREYRKLDN